MGSNSSNLDLGDGKRDFNSISTNWEVTRLIWAMSSVGSLYKDNVEGSFVSFLACSGPTSNSILLLVLEPTSL